MKKSVVSGLMVILMTLWGIFFPPHVARALIIFDGTSCGPDSDNSGHGDHDPAPCSITTTKIDANTEQVRIDHPVVDRSSYDYNDIKFAPGDHVSISANGCAQTGGSSFLGGGTWKRYVNPSGPDSYHYYFGTMTIPDALIPDERNSGVHEHRLSETGITVVFPQFFGPTPHLILGYSDDQDDYDDNGYWGPDNGDGDQCKNTNSNYGGPAYVVLTITHGIPGPWANIPAAPFDIMLTQGLDFNGLFLNPRWGWQVPGSDINTDGNYNSCADPGFPNLRCTGQPTTFDGIDIDIFRGAVGVCNLIGGHINWFEVAYTGKIIWDGHDAPYSFPFGFGDDDYNMELVTPLAAKLLFSLDSGIFPDDLQKEFNDHGIALSHLTVSDVVQGSKWLVKDQDTQNEYLILRQQDKLSIYDASKVWPGGVTAQNQQTMHLEFDSDETVDEFENTPWWSDFHSTVDNDLEGYPYTHFLVDGHDAVVIGLMGIDAGHKAETNNLLTDRHSEVHPVHVLAIRETYNPDPDDDAWAIFVRNWGDEGECSQNQHYLDLTTIRVELPPPVILNAVGEPETVFQGTPEVGAGTLFRTHNVTVAPSLSSQPSPRGGSVHTFYLPPGSERGWVAGEIHVHWNTPSSGAASQATVQQSSLVLPQQASPGVSISTSSTAAQATSVDDITDHDDEVLVTLWDQMTPQQRDAVVALERALFPPPPPLQLGTFVSQPVDFLPPLPSSVPTVSTSRAERKIERQLSKFQAFCGVLGGSPAFCANLPSRALCQDVTVPTDLGVCSAASVSVNAGSFDPAGGPLTFSQTPAGPYGLGTTPIALAVADNHGDSSSCTATVTVVDKQPPVITCPAPQVECTGPNGAAVSLSPIVSDNCPGVSASCTPSSGSLFPLGATPISCNASDGTGNASTCSSIVTVRDTTAPVIATMSASPAVLWSPNHTMVPVTVTVRVTDVCDPHVGSSCQIVSVASNEPINGLGDGDKAPDWQITGSLTANLRAERAGTGSGRVYTLTVQCTDASGNSATKTATVAVPHN